MTTPQPPKEYYEGQFSRVTVPLKGPGLKHYQHWYYLIIEAAFRTGIKTGW